MMTNLTQRGRQALRVWEESKPDNFFAADVNLQHVLRRYMGDRYEAHADEWRALGGHAATTLDVMAKIEDLIGNHPRLDRWSGIGERIEAIAFHPNHDAIGRIIWQSGIMAMQAHAGNTVRQMGLYYLLSHNGEGGHMCSLACTSGLIRALQLVADAAVRDKFLPPLLKTDYAAMHHGAQFLTEVQGGSDVGANAVVATPAEDGTWRIHGEKWFCSNVNADQFLMTARPEGASEGTRGLGLFLVPRRLDDGTTNGFYIRRLKDKLGTRTLASAELDFRDAVAYPIGPLDKGFKNAVELVLNTSRLMNTVACAGIMRRAYIEAATYACHREAFGGVIANYPLVQEAVADILSENYAAVATSFYVAHLVDKMDTGEATEDDKGAYRLLVNINKYITSIRATEMVHRAIEVLGGNGAIESFSILPRLYRDMIVLESWEGTHNVLCLQVLRDIARYGIYEPFARHIEAHLQTVNHPQLMAFIPLVRAHMEKAEQMMTKLLVSESAMQVGGRRFVDMLCHITALALLLAEAQEELDNLRPTVKPDVIAHYATRHLQPDYDPLNDTGYLPRLQRLMAVI